MTKDYQVGTGDLRFWASALWPRWPRGWVVHEVTAVATDSQDRVFVFNRGDHPVAVFDAAGNPLFSWGEGLFRRPHGITIGPDDAVYLTDDSGHCVHKFTPEGKLLMTLGTPDAPSETGASSVDFRNIRRAAGPFNYPTNLAVAANGELFVSDGYGNARVHRFAPDGRLLASWGAPGAGPGEFHVPHGIAIDGQGNVVVADRENSRLQFFSPAGEFLAQWTDVARPCDVALDHEGRVYVAELGYWAGMWPGTEPPHPGATGGRVSIFDRDGKLLARWGGGDNPIAVGDFYAPHDIWLDSHGDLYVSEVIRSAAKGVRPAEGDYHTLQKFELCS